MYSMYILSKRKKKLLKFIKRSEKCPSLHFYFQSKYIGLFELCVCMCVHTHLHVQTCPPLCYPIDCSPPGPSVHGISRQKYQSGLPFPSPGDLSNTGIKPESPVAPPMARNLLANGSVQLEQLVIFHSSLLLLILLLNTHPQSTK